MRPDSCSNHKKSTTKVSQSTDLLKLPVEPLFLYKTTKLGDMALKVLLRTSNLEIKNMKYFAFHSPLTLHSRYSCSGHLLP